MWIFTAFSRKNLRFSGSFMSLQGRKCTKLCIFFIIWAKAPQTPGNYGAENQDDGDYRIFHVRVMLTLFGIPGVIVDKAAVYQYLPLGIGKFT